MHWKNLIATDHDLAATVARLTLGIVMFPHGAQKVLGWFGGYGFEGTMGFFTGTMGLPWIVAFLVIMGEFLGSIGLIVGALSRVAAGGLVVIMLGAIFTAHLQYGFFMNWSGNQGGEGFEYHLLVIGLAIITVIRGGGAFSIDERLAAKA